MAAGLTYVPIATQTLGSATASVTFSSIPSTYTDLVVAINYGLSADADSRWIINGDSTSGLYSSINIRGNGSAVAVSSASALNYLQFGLGSVTVPSTLTSTKIIHLQNYANTSIYKTSISSVGDAQAQTLAIVGLWRNTAAITSLTFNAISANFLTGSTFTIYGIAAA